MSDQELEERYVRSLDLPPTTQDEDSLLEELQRRPELSNRLAQHKKVRELLTRKKPVSFGPYFAAKLLYKIENTGIVIDRQLFSFFKKFQLAALGVIVGLLILNVLFTDQATLTSIFGLDRTATPASDEAQAPFDFFETLNKNL
jgi:hypothetical protein